MLLQRPLARSKAPYGTGTHWRCRGHGTCMGHAPGQAPSHMIVRMAQGKWPRGDTYCPGKADQGKARYPSNTCVGCAGYRRKPCTIRYARCTNADDTYAQLQYESVPNACCTIRHKPTCAEERLHSRGRTPPFTRPYHPSLHVPCTAPPLRSERGAYMLPRYVYPALAPYPSARRPAPQGTPHPLPRCSMPATLPALPLPLLRSSNSSPDVSISVSCSQVNSACRRRTPKVTLTTQRSALTPAESALLNPSPAAAC